jgi:hypothetical protein
MKIYNYLIIILLSLVLISSASAQQSLGSFKTDSTISLIQGCENSTYSNISFVFYPNSTASISSEKVMIASGDFYRYNYSFTNPSGTYVVYGHCDENGVDTQWAYDFFVNPAGIILNTAQMILYSLMYILVLVFMVLSLFTGLTIPFGNEKTFNGGIVTINWRKYIKIFSWLFFYFMILTFTWLTWNLVWAYSDWETLTVLLRYLFTLEIALSLPVFIGVIIISFVNFRIDRKAQEYIAKWGTEYNG